MNNIYFDNAATSFPKPKEVLDAIMEQMINFGGSANRGSSKTVLQSSRVVYECRETIKEFFNYDKSENVVFTNNITSSINILLNAVVKPNWHIITTSMDHNSVLRPLFKLKEELDGVEVDVINCDKFGFLNIDNLKDSIKQNTKLIILSHSSNLVGSIQPLKEISNICKEKNIFLILDSAQSAGIIPIDMQDLSLSALTFTGHKSLLGPQGIGGFIIDNKLNAEAKSIFVGGTGSNSSLLTQPDFLPDKFECGTLNIPGIVGLLHGINYINKEGISTIKEKEDFLCQKAINGLLNIKNIKIYGSLDMKKKTSVISFNINDMDPSLAGYILDSEFNISSRTGLHCAPLAHKTVGSYPNGSIRISLGYFNTEEEIDIFLNAINTIKNRR